MKQDKSLRAKLLDLPVLPAEGLRDCQIRAITNLDKSFKATRPRALIQMATGSGKTFTAVTSIYRLLKFAKAQRVLFLVDTKNLGEQAEQEQEKLQELTGNRSASEIARVLLNAYDPDMILDKARIDNSLSAWDTPTEWQTEAAQEALIREAAVIFTGELVEYVDNVRKIHEQIIDTVNIDRVIFAGWDQQAQDQAQSLIQNFIQFIEAHKDEITALHIFYNQPYQRRGVTYQML